MEKKPDRPTCLTCQQTPRQGMQAEALTLR